ncbi:hypothetical protein M0802_013090 [Mischocyttarus mexicanus]|nr:hypothetical protein M0802_013090 [Mischocyttarus mexicanus]
MEDIKEHYDEYCHNFYFLFNLNNYLTQYFIKTIPYKLNLEIETLQEYNLKSSESTHVGSNDLEYNFQEAGITCNKQITKKQGSFIKIFKDNKRKRTFTPPAETMSVTKQKIKGNPSNNITLQNRYAVLAAENDKIKVDNSDNSESSSVENSENVKSYDTTSFNHAW